MVWEKYAITNLINILGSLGLALFGLWLARRLRHKLLVLFSQSKKNQTIKLFLTNSIYAGVLVIAGIVVLGKLGVPTASLITLLGTSSLAIGLALKDFLSNIAAGIILVFQRPFEIGDLVELSGTLGVVENIDLFNVTVKTPANEMVVIPNGKLIKEKIINKAYHGMRRLELNVSVSYDANLKKAKTLVYDIIDKDQRSLSKPEPLVAVGALADSGVTLLIQAWVKKEDFNGLKFALLEEIKLAFDKHGIQIPFQQIDINMKPLNAVSLKRQLESTEVELLNA